MNNPITVKIESNIDITDEHKNEMREKLIYVFIEQLRRSGMYKVTEEKDGNLWILRADLVLPKKYEAEPVKHGRWEERHYTEMKWIPSRFDNVSPEDVDIEPMVELKCSKCHLWSVNFRNHTELKYCPMCGARMDGDSE